MRGDQRSRRQTPMSAVMSACVTRSKSRTLSCASDAVKRRMHNPVETCHDALLPRACLVCRFISPTSGVVELGSPLSTGAAPSAAAMHAFRPPHTQCVWTRRPLVGRVHGGYRPPLWEASPRRQTLSGRRMNTQHTPACKRVCWWSCGAVRAKTGGAE